MEEKEKQNLEELFRIEDLAEKKAKIYSRLLTDVEKAKRMEELASRHEKRKNEISELLFGEMKNTKKDGAGTR